MQTCEILSYFCLRINILKGYYWILRIGLMGRCQKVPKFDFQSQKLSESFSIFFSLKNINLGAHFLLLTFFDNFKIERLLFLKWLLIFDTSPLTQFSKFNNFLWVCWFLVKNLSNFVPPAWKLHNPYCHTWNSVKDSNPTAPQCFWSNVSITCKKLKVRCYIRWTEKLKTNVCIQINALHRMIKIYDFHF